LKRLRKLYWKAGERVILGGRTENMLEANAPKEVLDLVERFERNLDAYRSDAYNETRLRREFIDPFFGALGWDIENKSGAAEAYKDVIHEDSIKIGGATKAPDYCFRIGGTRKFFVEAKKPAVNVRQESASAFGRRIQDHLVTLVRRMLALSPQLAEAKSPPAKTPIERQIQATDAAIDRLVFELYGLSEEEMRIAGGETNPWTPV
jgi:hypothetical protein